MTKLVRVDPHYWPNDDYGYWCPGCKSMHEIAVTKRNTSGASWSFDGNALAPTFSPSINYRVNTPDMGEHYQPDIASTVCHHFVRVGMIQFLDDCTHELRGRTVPLPDFPADRHPSCERLI